MSSYKSVSKNVQCSILNCSLTKFVKFIAIIINVLVFFMQILRMSILLCSSRTFFDFSSDFFTLSFTIFERSLLLSLRSKSCCYYKVVCSIAEWSIQLGMDREVSGLNPGGVNYFSTRLSLESNSSNFSRFMFGNRETSFCQDIMGRLYSTSKQDSIEFFHIMAPKENIAPEMLCLL